MTTAELHSFYSQRINEFTSKKNELTRKANTIAHARLLTGVCILISVYIGFTQTWALWVSLLLLIAFFWLIKKHLTTLTHKRLYENLTTINDQELQAISGEYSHFDAGHEFNDDHHVYAHDLDIVGNGSLFQFINRTCTTGGKTKLATSLLSSLTTDHDITERQKAIHDVRNKVELRQRFSAVGRLHQEYTSDRSSLLTWSAQKPFIYGNLFYKIILIVAPSITLITLALAVMHSSFIPYLIAAALFQWGFLGFHLRKINSFHQYVNQKKNILRQYATLLSVWKGDSYTSFAGQSLKKTADEAERHVQSLANLVSAFDARLNMMTSLVTNALLLYDLQCVYRLERWKEEHAANLNTWLNAVEEMDMLCSYGTFAYNNPDFTFATLQASGQIIEAENLAHPLLRSSARVANSIALGGSGSIMIITGANMAGKSTFLRTLGVNMVLALAGAPVCATRFACPIIEMRTGMRTTDSLKENQSYFFAELNRLQRIMNELRTGKPLLILLDEILKGTNSTDKQNGSLALVQQLADQNCLVVIATHDIVLGELAARYPEKIQNYCFEADVVDDELFFDYKIKKGIATKMNASFLMKKMGIIS